MKKIKNILLITLLTFLTGCNISLTSSSINNDNSSSINTSTLSDITSLTSSSISSSSNTSISTSTSSTLNDTTSSSSSSSSSSSESSSSSKEEVMDCIVTLELNGGVLPEGTSSIIIVSYGDTLELPTPTKHRYIFDGWFTENNSRFTNTTKVKEDLTLYANWTVDTSATYYVTFNLMYDNLSKVEEVTYGSKVNSYNHNRNGYTLLNWYEDSSYNYLFDFNTPIKNDLTLYAKWEKKITFTYNLMFDNNLREIEVSKGDKVDKYIPLRDGYVLEGWYKEETYSNLFDFDSKINEDTIIYAKWEVSNPNRKWNISSIDETLNANVYFENNELYFDVKKDSKVVVEKVLVSLGVESYFDTLEYYEETSNTNLSYSYNNISGSYSKVTTNFNELIITFKGNNNLLLDVTFRIYNDGYAFRYGIRNLDNFSGEVTINEENTSYLLPTNAETHSMVYNGVSKWFSYEEYYEVYDASSMSEYPMSMPFLYQTSDGIWSMISESELIGSQYIGSFLQSVGNRTIETIPAFGAEMDFEVSYPFETPWRIGITGDLETIVESTLVEDVYDDTQYWRPDNYESLSEEEKKIYDYEWVEPGVVAWNWLSYTGVRSQKDWDLHREYIDLAVEMSWPYIILDGGWVPSTLEEIAGFADMMDYADSKGIKVIAWGHAMNDFGTYSKLTATLDKWKTWGIDGIKIDFFDGQGVSDESLLDITGQGEHQLTIKHYERVYQECAKRQMVVNCHGSNKPTGERRQYPHVLNREGIRGNEMKKMYVEQLTSIPFLRGVTGPSDYTPTLVPLYSSSSNGGTTIGLQLALHILYESGLPSMAGKVDEYLTSPAKQFLRDLPATWDELEYISGTPRNDTVLARRKGNDWWVGGITNNAQTFNIDLSFLDEGNYSVEIYYDGSSYTELLLRNDTVTNDSQLTISAPAKGGFAIRIISEKFSGSGSLSGDGYGPLH